MKRRVVIVVVDLETVESLSGDDLATAMDMALSRIGVVRNLTSFELEGDPERLFDKVEAVVDQHLPYTRKEEN